MNKFALLNPRFSRNGVRWLETRFKFIELCASAPVTQGNPRKGDSIAHLQEFGSRGWTLFIYLVPLQVQHQLQSQFLPLLQPDCDARDQDAQVAGEDGPLVWTLPWEQLALVNCTRSYCPYNIPQDQRQTQTPHHTKVANLWGPRRGSNWLSNLEFRRNNTESFMVVEQ